MAECLLRLGMHTLIYEPTASALSRKLVAHYQKWHLEITKAVSFAQEDLEAYCVSWKAAKTAIRFILGYWGGRAPR